MGVSIEVWRQRIGRFKMPSSRASRPSGGEVIFPGDGIRIGIGGATFLVIFLSVALGYAAMLARCNLLMTCGDVELNPGPDAPLLPDDMLQKLREGQPIYAIPGGLVNKHIVQLQNLHKELGCSWATVVTWLKRLLPHFPTDGEHWSRNIQYQWEKTILGKRSLHLKSQKKYPERLHEWEETPYTLPVVKGPQQHKSPKATPMTKFEAEFINKSNEKLKQECQQLKQEVEGLKLRPSPHKVLVDTRREASHKATIRDQKQKLKDEEKAKQKLDDRLTNVIKGKRRLTGDFKKLNAKHARIEDEKANEQDDYVLGLENETVEVEDLKEELKQCREVNSILLDAAIMWRSKLAEVENDELTLMKQGSFSNNTRKCVYELLGYHVAQEKVTKVIEAVLQLAKKKCEQIPKPSTVRVMADEMLAVSQVQLEALSETKNMSLQTDETPKFGQCYEAYIVNTDDQDSYLLGMRHMADKSAQITLDTFKEILEDIDNTCKQLVNTDNTGHKILTKIHSTMSDRAATEYKFHNILQSFREECLPLYRQHWDTFSEEAQEKLTDLHQFFCGLHLMVGMADTVNATFKTIEALQDPEEDAEDDVIGTSTDSESVIVRCVRTICKALARGADPKSGRHKDWKTYCAKIHQPNYTSMLQTFKGNRFNIIFLLGGNVYYLKEHILKCLEEVPEPKNKLIRVALALMNRSFNIAGCKALGILRKFVMMPLWRITEKQGHILDMNNFYNKLNEFLISCKDEQVVRQLMKGENMPFPEEYVERDLITEALTATDEMHDVNVASILSTCLASLQRYIQKTVQEHLPGGKYWEPDDGLQQATTSAPKHNKNPERVFGLLDFLCHHRPNATTLSNEAVLMFVYNKTSVWLNNKTPEELDELCREVKHRSRNMRDLYKRREADILEKHIKKSQDESVRLEQKNKKKLLRKTDLTSSIINSGLWQSKETVDENMAACTSNAERKRALIKQLIFRNEVLCQLYKGPIPKIYCATFTENKVKHVRTWEELRACLLALVDAAASIDTSITVSKNTKEREKLPMLVGKTINHKFDDGIAWRGTVISQVPGFCSWFNVKYVNDESIYSFRLIDDYKSGNVEIVPVLAIE